MFHPHRFIPAAAAALLVMLGTAGTAAADELAFAAEVDSCVSALDGKLDLASANRVRHLVTDSKRTGIGYALTIETSVFTPVDEKHYAVYCVANGSNAPLKLRIEDLAL